MSKKLLKYVIFSFLMALSLESYAQIIKRDMGGVSGMGGIISPPTVPMGKNFKPIGTDMKPMEQKIQHEAPELEQCFSISTDGRQEIEAINADSLNEEKSRKFLLDVMSVYDAAGREEAKQYYGEITVKSVVVHSNSTRIVLEARNFSNIDWFLVSKASVIIDNDTRKPYFITDVEKSNVLDKSFALNLTRNSYQQICLVFPKLDSWVTMIDLICPMPDKTEVQYMNASGGYEETKKKYEGLNSQNIESENNEEKDINEENNNK